MSFQRILGILYQEYYMTRRAYETIADVFVFPIISIIVFGFLALYLASKTNPAVAHSMLAGILLWQTISIVQYSIPVGALWNIWWKNLSNLFITPLTNTEYIIALTISGVCKSLIVFTLGSIMSYFVFHFNILELGLVNIILFITNLMVFGFSFGVFILGFIFKLGTRMQAFAWGLLPLLQPLSAVFYPIDVLPMPIRWISYFIPTTYIFEAVRKTIEHKDIYWSYIITAGVENLILLCFALWFFNKMLISSKNTGQFARNES